MDDDKSSLKGFFRRMKNQSEEENIIEEEIMNMINDGHEQGYIEEKEAEMISNIFEFGDKEAKEIMTFRQKITGVDVEMSLQEAVYFMLEHNYSRYPLYEEDLDNIVGVLYFKDAVTSFLKKEDTTLREIARPVTFTHDTIRIHDLLKQMQEEQIHMAIVLDEYGQTDGIVTLEDIIEVIVGDIYDEYDEEEQEITQLTGNDSYLIQGMTRLDEVEELLEIEFPDEDIETINGFMLCQLGHLPEADEDIEIEYEGYSFKPIDIHDNMIKQIKVSKIKESETKEN